MTPEQYFSLKEGDVLRDEHGQEVYVSCDMLGFAKPEDIPLTYVIMGYRDKLYGSDYVKILRNEIHRWEHTGINIKGESVNQRERFVIDNQGK